MKHDSLYIIMPAYNEEKNIGTVIEQWYPVVERIGGDSRLVILNDGSKDATYKKIQNYQKNYDRLIGIDKPNEGHGGTILRGYRYAVEKGADYIFQTDSDGQTLPEEFWQFWEKRQKCGILIGKVLKRIPSGFFLSNVLMTVIYEKHHLYVEYIPITFRPRQAGKNSINMKRIIKIGRQAFADFIRLRGRI